MAMASPTHQHHPYNVVCATSRRVEKSTLNALMYYSHTKTTLLNNQWIECAREGMREDTNTHVRIHKAH